LPPKALKKLFTQMNLSQFLKVAAVTTLCYFQLPAQAQNAPSRLYNTTRQELQSGKFETVNLFQVSTQRNEAIDAAIQNVVYLKLDKQALQKVLRMEAKGIRFSLPLAGTTTTLDLYSYNILDKDFKVWTRDESGNRTEMAYTPGLFYRGVVSNEQQSMAALTFHENEIAGVFSTLSDGNYNLVLNYEDPGVNRDQYLLFREADIIGQTPTSCAFQEDLHSVPAVDDVPTAERASFEACRHLRVSLHADYRLYQRKNQNATQVTNYLTDLFNVIAALYINEGISVKLSETVINSAPDGYTYGGSPEVLQKFGQEMQLVTLNGDLAQLVSGYRVNNFAPLGGLAWLDVLCFTPGQFPDGQGGTNWIGPYSMSNNNILNNVPELPVYSWDVNASAHEIGHNIGSEHTQSCTWPGGAIDGCVAPEGSCSPGPVPANGGTVMSYCHLNQVGVNFALGFGPLPGNRIRQRIGSKSCLASFQPTQTLDAASITRIANRQCSDGTWTYYHYDNMTASDEDDELILAIKTNGQNIGNVDDANFEIKMTTVAGYGSNQGRAVQAPYANQGWFEMNRTWTVTLPTGKQPGGEVSIRFPYTDKDVNDVKGSVALLTDASEMRVVSFKSQAAASNPGGASSSNVNLYTHSSAASPTQWRMLSGSNDFNYAEFVSDHGVHGGSMAFSASFVSIPAISAQATQLSIYPNPARNTLQIILPFHIQSGAGLEVYDALGRRVLQEQQLAGNDETRSVSLDVSTLASGVYHVRLQSRNHMATGTFVKE
jgi:hypothetical protein